MISVVVPIHNKLPHLDRSVQSILNQTFEEFELLLIDDASSDGSSERLRAYSDPRIRVLTRDTPGPGGYAARNLGIQEARYDWISFLDADDEWSSQYLKNVVAVIKQNPEVEFVSVGWEKVMCFQEFHKIEQVKTHSFDVYDYLANYKLAWTGAVTLKKELLLQIGGFPAENSKCKIGGDVDTWIRGLNTSKRNLHLSLTLVYYYQETVNQVTDANKNPTSYFCAYDTVKSLYRQTINKKQRKVVRKYINSKIVQILRRPHGFRFSLIFKMYPTYWGFKSLMKVMLIKLKIMK